MSSGRRFLLVTAFYFVGIGAFPPDALFWDGIGFLLRAGRGELHLDPGHALYVPSLRLSHGLGAALGIDSWERTAKLFSALGATLFFALLWRRLERRRLGSAVALALAGIGATTPLLWRQAGIVEPTTWMLAALLLAASAAERYAEKRTVARGLAFVGAVLLLLGFHLVAGCALPWLLERAGLTRRRAPRAHLLVPLIALALVLLGLWLTGTFATLPSVQNYWRGFLPQLRPDVIAEHATKLGLVLTLGMPGVLVLGLLGTAVARRKRSEAGPGDDTGGALWLAVPYLAAFLLLGKPVVGFSTPLTVALVLAAATGLERLAQKRELGRRIVFAVLVLQLLHGGWAASQRASAPDELQERAERYAAALPPGSVLFAGTCAYHVRWFTDVPVVAVGNELHTVRPAPGQQLQEAVLERLGEMTLREAATYEDVYYASDVLGLLEWLWQIDKRELPLNPSRIVLIRRHPPLFLLPVHLPEQKGSKQPEAAVDAAASSDHNPVHDE